MRLVCAFSSRVTLFNGRSEFQSALFDLEELESEHELGYSHSGLECRSFSLASLSHYRNGELSCELFDVLIMF